MEEELSGFFAVIPILIPAQHVRRPVFSDVVAEILKEAKLRVIREDFVHALLVTNCPIDVIGDAIASLANGLLTKVSRAALVGIKPEAKLNSLFDNHDALLGTVSKAVFIGPDCLPKSGRHLFSQEASYIL